MPKTTQGFGQGFFLLLGSLAVLALALHSVSTWFIGQLASRYLAENGISLHKGHLSRVSWQQIRAVDVQLSLHQPAPITLQLDELLVTLSPSWSRASQWLGQIRAVSGSVASKAPIEQLPLPQRLALLAQALHKVRDLPLKTLHLSNLTLTGGQATEQSTAPLHRGTQLSTQTLAWQLNLSKQDDTVSLNAHNASTLLNATTTAATTRITLETGNSRINSDISPAPATEQGLHLAGSATLHSRDWQPGTSLLGNDTLAPIRWEGELGLAFSLHTRSLAAPNSYNAWLNHFSGTLKLTSPGLRLTLGQTALHITPLAAAWELSPGQWQMKTVSASQVSAIQAQSFIPPSTLTFPQHTHLLLNNDHYFSIQAQEPLVIALQNDSLNHPLHLEKLQYTQAENTSIKGILTSHLSDLARAHQHHQLETHFDAIWGNALWQVDLNGYLTHTANQRSADKPILDLQWDLHAGLETQQASGHIDSRLYSRKPAQTLHLLSLLRDWVSHIAPYPPLLRLLTQLSLAPDKQQALDMYDSPIVIKTQTDFADAFSALKLEQTTLNISPAHKLSSSTP